MRRRPDIEAASAMAHPPGLRLDAAPDAAASSTWPRRWAWAVVCMLCLGLSPLEAQHAPDASATPAVESAASGSVADAASQAPAPSPAATAAVAVPSAASAQRAPDAPRIPVLPNVVRLAVPTYGAMPHADYNQGRPQGMSVALIREILGAKGIRVKYVPLPNVEEIARAMCEGRVDLAMSVTLTTARTRCIAYTDPYLQLGVYAVRQAADTRVINSETLKRMRIAVLKGSQIQVQAPDWFPKAQLIEVGSVGEALRLVDEGKADLYFDTPPIIRWHLEHERYPHLNVLATDQLPAAIREPVVSLLFTAPHAQLPLLRLVDAELKRDPERIQRLRVQWLGEQAHDENSTASLTNAQREWLGKQPRLRIAIADNSAPLSTIDSDGKAEGILPDYIHMVEEHLGVQFEPVLGNGYKSVANAMLTGTADIALVPIGGLPGEHWVYSQPVDRIPTVIVTRHDNPAAIGMESLAGKRVSVNQLHRIGAAVLKAAPDARVVGVTTHAEGLRLVAAGKVDAHVGNLAVIDQVINTQFDPRSFQVAPADMEEDIAFVVDERLAPLIPIIDRQLSGMSEAEHQRIHTHWISADYNYGLAWSNVIVIVAGSLLAIAAISAFYLRLRQESRRRELADRKLREVAGNLPGVVFKAQRSASGHIRFPYLTGRSELLFGVGAERLVAEERLIYSRVHPADRRGLGRAICDAALTRGEINADFRVLTDDGSIRWVRVNALPQRPQPDDEGQASYAGYFVDVTDAHAQAEALAAAKEQAEAATRAKSNFLATMSHEIRTPMGGMVGMLELLGQSDLNEDQNVLLGHMQDSAHSLQDILDDILDVSKIEAGHLRLEHAPMQPRALADAVAMHTASACRKKGLRLDVQVDAAVARFYLGDAMRLRQVLLNLLGNAVKFTERGGVWLDIGLDEAAPPASDADPAALARLRIEIGDTGIGMNAEQVARVFEPFHQADDSTSRRFGGTGLGLSICRSLVELMGGTIRIDSREGEGTRVIASLPLSRAEVPVTDPAPLRVAVAVRDPRRAQALRQQLLALGNEMAEPDAAAELLFVDGEVADTVRVLRRPDSPTDYVIDANPLLHLQVVRACAWSRDPSGDGHGERSPLAAIEAPRAARILVVEDNAVNRELIRRQLAQLGYGCDLCDDGNAALAALCGQRYDLVLTDCQMPLVDGYTLTREIRERERRNGEPRLPIIAITASALPEQVDQCIAAGMDAYLIKPVHLPELRETLQHWLPAEAGDGPNEATFADAAPSLVVAPALQKVVPVLLRELPQDLARIDQAIASGSGLDAAAAVHRAVGSIALFDIGLARIGQQLELQLRSEAVADLDHAV
ncbi:MAG: transporter substrate-binding domain-containing protein, partial [Lysobacter sp.]|nr:transporter substrate-binding domain-containing protein [Lysobacter sp.]